MIIKNICMCESLVSVVYAYGISPVCVLICSVSILLSKNTASNWLDWYSSSHMFIIIWSARIVRCLKALSQWLHIYGLPPVCVFHMFSKCTFLCKCLITLAALKWFLSCVFLYMIVKMKLMFENLVRKTTLFECIHICALVSMVCHTIHMSTHRG